MNNDPKIFSRLLSNRLSTIISTLIFPCQSGFIPGHPITDNIRLASNIVQDANLRSKAVVLLSLDINKTFNSVSWKYMDSIFRRYVFKKEFLQAFHARYHKPYTRIRMPDCNSDFFEVGRRTRQGCPLLPLLFALAYEPLAIATLSHPDIKGYTVGSITYKLGICADDMLLFLPQPFTTLPNMFQSLQLFAQNYGLTVNILKSIGVPVNIPPTQFNSIHEFFPFIWSMDALTYLGINLTPDIKDLITENYISLIQNEEA